MMFILNNPIKALLILSIVISIPLVAMLKTVNLKYKEYKSFDKKLKEYCSSEYTQPSDQLACVKVGIVKSVTKK